MSKPGETPSTSETRPELPEISHVFFFFVNLENKRLFLMGRTAEKTGVCARMYVCVRACLCACMCACVWRPFVQTLTPQLSDNLITPLDRVAANRRHTLTTWNLTVLGKSPFSSIFFFFLLNLKVVGHQVTINLIQPLDCFVSC